MTPTEGHRCCLILLTTVFILMLCGHGAAQLVGPSVGSDTDRVRSGQDDPLPSGGEGGLVPRARLPQSNPPTSSHAPTGNSSPPYGGGGGGGGGGSGGGNADPTFREGSGPTPPKVAARVPNGSTAPLDVGLVAMRITDDHGGPVQGVPVGVRDRFGRSVVRARTDRYGVVLLVIPIRENLVLDLSCTAVAAVPVQAGQALSVVWVGTPGG